MRTLYGKGTALSNQKAVQRRAKSKLITQTLMLRLVDVAKEKGAADRVKAYWNTYHCQNNLLTSEGRMYAPHCKNRFCTYCCGIRKAALINKYLPVLKEWKDPYFVTLTVKAVSAKRLPLYVNGIQRAFRQIKEKHRKRSERAAGEKFMGLKSLECNFNPRTRTYNPHLHLIVPTEEAAERLVQEWLQKWTPKYTHRGAQHYRPIRDREKDLVEVIKYEAKVFTEPDQKKGKGKGKAIIYASALDNIYAALKGKRVFDGFGFRLPKQSKPKTECRLTDDYMLWQYHPKSRDWVSEEHESTLTAYQPDWALEALLEENIDTELQ